MLFTIILLTWNVITNGNRSIIFTNASEMRQKMCQSNIYNRKTHASEYEIQKLIKYDRHHKYEDLS
jgi:hypothetical protein